MRRTRTPKPGRTMGCRCWRRRLSPRSRRGAWRTRASRNVRALRREGAVFEEAPLRLADSAAVVEFQSNRDVQIKPAEMRQAITVIVVDELGAYLAGQPVCIEVDNWLVADREEFRLVFPLRLRAVAEIADQLQANC